MKLSRNKLAVAIMASAVSFQAAAEDFALEEIVVTAQKKSESLMDVPVSVTAVTGETLNDIGVFDLTELDKATSGLEVTGDGKVAMRGTDSSLTSYTASQRVTTYFNGSYMPNQLEFWLSNYDMDRVEILRGPQGTLYGSSSPSGAIVAYPKKPSLSNKEGYISQTFGEHNLSSTQFAYGAPIIEDELAIRIAGSYNEDGSSGGEYLDGTEYEKRTESFRVSLIWAPSDIFDANLSHSYSEIDDNTAPYFQGNGLEPGDRVNPGNVDTLAALRINTSILTLNWDLGFADLVSQTFYSESTNKQITDSDYSQQDHQVTIGGGDVRTYNQEFRLSSLGNDFWDWSVGSYYSVSDTTITGGYTTNYLIPNMATFNPGDGTVALDPLYSSVESVIDSYTEGYGLFTHNTFFLAEDWSLVVGLRWNKGRTISNVDVEGDSDLPAPFGNLATFDYKTDYGVNSEIYWTGTVKLQHNITDDSNVYLTFDRGTRMGSSATDFTGDIARLLNDKFLFDSENSNSFELGYKASLLEGRLNVTTALHHTTFKDFQINAAATVKDTLAPFGAGERYIAFIDNAPEVIIQGIDLTASYLAAENLLLGASISYAKSEFEDYSEAPVVQGGAGALLSTNGAYLTQDLSGEDVGGLAPRLSATFSATYNQSINFLSSEWYLSGLMNYTGERTDAFSGNDTGSYTTFDLSTGLRTDQWDVRLWVKNVFDREANLAPNGGTEGNGVDTLVAGVSPGSRIQAADAANYAPPAGSTPFGVTDSGYYWGPGYINPRQVGVTATYNF